MTKINIYKTKRDKRRSRIRPKVYGTPEKPRLSVFRSNKYIYAQLIDDVASKTLASVFSSVKEIHKSTKRVDAAFNVGKEMATKALELNVTKVAFDRSGYKYHGRVKSLADGAREGGLQL